MIRYYITNHHFFDGNEGINKEQCLDFHFNGRCGKHDNEPFDKGSDLPEQRMSVKSAKFSLCSYGMLRGESFEEMLDDFFARVASTSFAYVTKTYEVYEMDAVEFREFLGLFSYASHDYNGKGSKIKGRSESKKMLLWLSERVR